MALPKGSAAYKGTTPSISDMANFPAWKKNTGAWLENVYKKEKSQYTVIPLTPTKVDYLDGEAQSEKCEERIVEYPGSDRTGWSHFPPH
jgi:hypothetical protein